MGDGGSSAASRSRRSRASDQARGPRCVPECQHGPGGAVMTHLAIRGSAGSGKTTRVRALAIEGTAFTSTTGVSAVNPNDGAATIQSLLRFHDGESFVYQRDHGKF